METKTIYTKLLAVMKGVGAVGKDRKNQQQGYSFRGIDDVMNELHDKFSEHGILVLTDIIDQRREERTSKNGGLMLYSVNTYRFTFVAEDGSSVVVTQVGEGMDSGDKASNKAASVALKYALLFMFLIPTEEPKDPENESQNLSAPKQTTQQTPKPAAPATPAKNGTKTPVLLSPEDKENPDRWAKVITWLKDNNKTEQDWPKIKNAYIITEASEKKLFEELGWLPF